MIPSEKTLAALVEAYAAADGLQIVASKLELGPVPWKELRSAAAVLLADVTELFKCIKEQEEELVDRLLEEKGVVDTIRRDEEAGKCRSG